eukprot:scaffold29562_cov71-Phaeocystis_antarctica.AAC.1
MRTPHRARTLDEQTPGRRCAQSPAQHGRRAGQPAAPAPRWHWWRGDAAGAHLARVRVRWRGHAAGANPNPNPSPNPNLTLGGVATLQVRSAAGWAANPKPNPSLT